MIEVVPLKYGVVFKKAFGKPEVFCAFVEDIILSCYPVKIFSCGFAM